MLWTHARVVQAGTDRVRLSHLAVLILEKVGAHAMQHTRATGRQRRRVMRRIDTLATGLYTDQTHRRIINERIKHANRIAAATNTSNHSIRETACLFL